MSFVKPLKLCQECRYLVGCGGMSGDIESVGGEQTFCWRFSPTKTEDMPKLPVHILCPKHPFIALQEVSYERNVGYCPQCGSLYCLKSGHQVHESIKECLEPDEMREP